MTHNYISSVCFIRKYGNPDKNMVDTITPKTTLTKQIESNRTHNIPGTYLLQYDALIDEEYQTIAKAEYAEAGAEIGCWIEIVRPLCEDAGIVWRGADGRMWDHGVEPGFLMAYTLEEKKHLIDTQFAAFEKVFGFTPKTVGSWLLDSESMAYMTEKYAPDAYIICREQWGMDGYTLWGGPYYGAFYPCKNNMQCPAQTAEQQINTPVFRMFVNDPIYCYYEYAREKYNGDSYGLFTQEPVWRCGQDHNWVKWHYNQVFREDNMGFNFTQLGQESSFPWEMMQEAYPWQVNYALENAQKFGYRFVTFSEMGRDFKAAYTSTPEMLRYDLTDWGNRGNQSLWYNSHRYRVNLFADKDEVYIRDIHLFDENYVDQYLLAPCRTRAALYDNLPIMDGIRMTDDTTKACMSFGAGKMEKVHRVNGYAAVNIALAEQTVTCIMQPEKLTFESNKDFSLDFLAVEKGIRITPETNRVIYQKGSYTYALVLEKGSFIDRKIQSKDGKIIMTFALL